MRANVTAAAYILFEPYLLVAIWCGYPLYLVQSNPFSSWSIRLPTYGVYPGLSTDLSIYPSICLYGFGFHFDSGGGFIPINGWLVTIFLCI